MSNAYLIIFFNFITLKIIPEKCQLFWPRVVRNSLTLLLLLLLLLLLFYQDLVLMDPLSEKLVNSKIFLFQLILKFVQQLSQI